MPRGMPRNLGSRLAVAAQRCFLLSAELFLAHASIHSPDMFKEIGHIDMEFYNTIAWMLKQRDQTDIVVVSDGRNDFARIEIRKAFEREVCEAFDLF